MRVLPFCFLRTFCWVLLGILLTPTESAAVDRLTSTETSSVEVSDPFATLRANLVKFTLDNGLRVLFVKRDVGPVFSGELWVKTGGVDEKPGATGLAHFLEHMAFKGTDRIGTKDFKRESELLQKFEAEMEKADGDLRALEKPEIASLYRELNSLWLDNEFGRIYTRAGAVGLNAATSKDTTSYTISLPSNSFELWCWMESERLRAPVFRQFYKEKEVVLEERRARYDDDPAGKLYELLLETAYVQHPYRIPNIGYSEDLRRVTVGEMREFYRSYYRPDNMVLSIVGNLDERSVRDLVQRYFGRLQRSMETAPTLTAVEPKQTAPREAKLKLDAEPQLMMAYHKPIYPHPDDARFSIVHDLLAKGRTSLLEKELVRDKKLAISVSTMEVPGTRYPSLFLVYSAPMPGVSTERLRDAIQSVIDSLLTREITEQELQESKRRALIELLHQIRGDSDLASMVGMSELLWNEPLAVASMYETLQNTTIEDVRRLAREYLIVPNRTYVRIEKVGTRFPKPHVAEGRPNAGGKNHEP